MSEEKNETEVREGGREGRGGGERMEGQAPSNQPEYREEGGRDGRGRVPKKSRVVQNCEGRFCLPRQGERGKRGRKMRKGGKEGRKGKKLSMDDKEEGEGKEGGEAGK